MSYRRPIDRPAFRLISSPGGFVIAIVPGTQKAGLHIQMAPDDGLGAADAGEAITVGFVNAARPWLNLDFPIDGKLRFFRARHEGEGGDDSDWTDWSEGKAPFPLETGDGDDEDHGEGGGRGGIGRPDLFRMLAHPYGTSGGGGGYDGPVAEGDMLVGREGGGSWNVLPEGSPGQALVGTAVTGYPIWGTLGPTGGGTGIASYNQGEILYASASDVLSALAVPSTDGWALTWDSGTGLPEWRAVPSGGAVIASDVGGTGTAERTFSGNDRYTFPENLHVEGVLYVEGPAVVVNSPIGIPLSAAFSADRPDNITYTAGITFTTGGVSSTTFWAGLFPGSADGYIGTGATVTPAAASMRFAIGSQAVEFYGLVSTVASASGAAGFFMDEGAAPSSPNDGDVWMTSTGMFSHTSGAGTVGPFGGGVGSGTQNLLAKWATTTTLGDSRIVDSGSGAVGISADLKIITPGNELSVAGASATITLLGASGSGLSVVRWYDNAVSQLYGQIEYDFDNDLMAFWVNNTSEITLSSAGMYPTVTGGAELGLTGNRWGAAWMGALTATTVHATGTITPVASDRVGVGIIGSIPSNQNGAFVGWLDSSTGYIAGSLGLLARSSVAGDIVFFTGTPTLVERLIIDGATGASSFGSHAISMGALTATTGVFTGVLTTGDGGSTNYAQFSATGSLTFHGTAGMQYGGFWLHEDSVNVDISTAGNGVYVKIEGWNTSHLNGVSVNSDALRVTTPGIYFVFWHISGDSVAVNTDYELDVFVNDVEQDVASVRRQFGPIAALGAMAGIGTIDVTNATHDIDLRMKQVSAGADDFDITAGGLNILMIGGT